MKSSIKNIFISLLTLIIIVFLHYVVYLDKTNIELGYIEGYTSAPIDLPNIELQKEIRPTYFKPFQKLQYFYVDGNNLNNIIIEENKNLFKGHTTIIQGYDIVKKYHTESGDIFINSLASNEYPSIIYFILQYILISIFIVSIYKYYMSQKLIN